MIYEILRDALRLIRQHGRLSKQQLADLLGVARQTVFRWEKDGPIPNAETAAMIVDKVKLTRLALAEIMCRALSRFLNRPVMIAPEGRYMPAAPLTRASLLYNRYCHKLGRGTREVIDGMLLHGRSLEAVVEQTCTLFEKEVARLIEADLAARGESLSSDEPELDFDLSEPEREESEH